MAVSEGMLLKVLVIVRAVAFCARRLYIPSIATALPWLPIHFSIHPHPLTHPPSETRTLLLHLAGWTLHPHHVLFPQRILRQLRTLFSSRISAAHSRPRITVRCSTRR